MNEISQETMEKLTRVDLGILLQFLYTVHLMELATDRDFHLLQDFFYNEIYLRDDQANSMCPCCEEGPYDWYDYMYGEYDALYEEQPRDTQRRALKQKAYWREMWGKY